MFVSGLYQTSVSCPLCLLLSEDSGPNPHLAKISAVSVASVKSCQFKRVEDPALQVTGVASSSFG